MHRRYPAGHPLHKPRPSILLEFHQPIKLNPDILCNFKQPELVEAPPMTSMPLGGYMDAQPVKILDGALPGGLEGL
ncbi:hypothetical protein [Pseudomonas veronii]|uniref:hypothetical protein n=1 Tax=Pseudomonas veronii TaxID=76761 RepID=UPI0009A5269A|nr:hypothetical protein [Pseudomonas veronii]AQY65573.1 hypothetical protein PverR02_11045 [Pseudomonas veronii]